MAADEYDQITRDGPADQKITEVDEFVSLRPFCNDGCARAATDFVNRPGVTFEAGENGYTSSSEVGWSVAYARIKRDGDPVAALSAYAGATVITLLWRSARMEYLNLRTGENER
jgi:hypothetical protein